MPFFPFDFFPPPSPSSTPAAVPNPAETAWRLGTGTAVWEGRAVVGFDLVLSTTVLNGGVPVVYAFDDTLDASLWRGRDEAPMVVPGVSWISALSGTIGLTVPGTSTAGLDPGVYRLQVGVTAGGVRSLVFDGSIEFLETPGIGTTRVPYVRRRDLLFWYDQLDTLQTIKGGDATFLEQRVEASDEFDRDLVTRYDPRPGFVKTRRTTVDPVLGFDVPDPSAAPPSPFAVSAFVRAGGVIVDRNVREIVSKMAIARVLDRQEVMGGRNPYREEAAAFRAGAMGLWQMFDIQLDTDLDGTADMLIGRDVILLPAGTAP